MIDFLRGYEDPLPDSSHLDSLLNESAGKIVNHLTETTNMDTEEFLEILVNPMIDEATHRIGNSYDENNPEQLAAFEECLKTIRSISI